MRTTAEHTRSVGPPIREQFSGKSLSFGYVGDTLVLVHARPRPFPHEWDIYLAEIESKHPPGILVVVHPDCPGPDAAQRNQLVAGSGLTHAATSVILDSALQRGVMTAVNWLTRQPLRSFSPFDLEGAVVNARLSASALPAVRELVMRLSVAMGESAVFVSLGIAAPPR